MTTAADVTARVDALAAVIRESRAARAKILGPRRRIIASRVEVIDVLECGHEVHAKRGEGERRCCPFCVPGSSP